MLQTVVRSILIALLLAGTTACSDKESNPIVRNLESPAGQQAAEPYLFTDPAGAVYLSWIENRSGQQSLQLSRWEGEQWSAPVAVATGTEWFVNWADYPLVVTDGRGKFMAHVLEYSAPGTYTYDVKLTVSADGRNWSTPAVLHDDGKKAEHGFVSMAPLGENVLVSWLDGRNSAGDVEATAPGNTLEETAGHGQEGAMTVRAALVSYQGDKLEEWALDERVCDCCQTSAAITDNGPVVVYRDRSEGEIRDIAIVRSVNNTWTEPKVVHKDNWEINGCPVNGPRSQAIGNTLAIAWFTAADNQPAVKVIFSDNGGKSFGKPVVVSGAEAIGRVDLVLLDTRSALVSWMEGGTIRVAKVHDDGSQEQALLIASSSSDRSSGFPQMTLSGNTVLFAWTDNQSKTIRTAKLEL